MIDYSLHPVLIEVLCILNIQFSKEACPPYYFMYKNGCIMYIYLNPQYVIRNENNCSYIIAKSALITAKLEYAMDSGQETGAFHFLYPLLNLDSFVPTWAVL